MKYEYKASNGQVIECHDLRGLLETATEDKLVQQEFEDYDIFESQFLGQGEVSFTPDKLLVTVFGQVVTFDRIGWATYQYESCTL